MSNSKLLEGDKVVLSYSTKWDIGCEGNPLGVVGTVLYTEYDEEYDECLWLKVEWDNGRSNFYRVTDSDLIKVAP